MNDDEFAAVMETKKVVLDNVVDNLHAEEEDVLCKENNALVVEQDKKKDNEKFGLTNVFNYGDNESIETKKGKDKMHYYEVPILLSNNDEMLFLKKIFEFDLSCASYPREDLYKRGSRKRREC